MSSSHTRDGRGALARSQGFLAVASDGPLGEIEMTLSQPDRDEADYVVVRTGRRLRARHPVISASLVEAIDLQRRIVYLRGRADRLGELGEHLPLAV